MNRHHQPLVGTLIRDWRQLRRQSQLDLALEAEISQKHLSFIESGRSQPSRDMVMLLAEHLAVPLRERNALLLAAGYAPVYLERALEDPSLQAAKAAIDLVLRGHEPYPALAVDRHWTLLAANASVAPLLRLVTDAELLRPPVNVLRLALHPGGLAPAIVNLAEWQAHLVARLRQQIRATADPVLADLLAELLTYHAPAPPSRRGHGAGPRSSRDRGAAAITVRRSGPVPDLDHHCVWHAGRHHLVGAGARDLLSGRCRDKRGSAGAGGGAIEAAR
jgi:transcriptional regulator with XRE-family HTH domain